jgi:hypothetical protein
MAAASPLANKRVMSAYKQARQCHCDTGSCGSAAAGRGEASADGDDADAEGDDAAGEDAEGDGEALSRLNAATCALVM